MGLFLSYSIISGLILLALYLAYRLFLARENQHGFNRGVLLAIYLIAFGITPFIIPSSEIDLIPASQPAAGGAQSITLEGLDIAASEITPAAQPLWATLLLWLYLAGMIAVAVKTVITWARLIRVIRSCEKIRRDGYTLVIIDSERFAPFSWMRYMVLSRKDYLSDSSAIIAHEHKHIAARHWIDLLVAQAVCIVNWFNPAAWLMRDELMLVHEYQADMAVIDSGNDVRRYQMLLIRKAVGARFPSLANSLNHSKLKKRITMMYKQKSGAGRKMKALALVPVLAAALAVLNVPAMRAAVSTVSTADISVGKINENTAADKTATSHFKIININHDGSKTTVTISGKDLGNSLTVSGGTYTSSGKTYQADALLSTMTNGNATITATFPCAGKTNGDEMTLTVNGKEVPFNLDELKGNVISIKKKSDAETTTNVTVSTGSSVSSLAGMKISINGRDVTDEELRNLPSEKIESITVDKQNNRIKITLQ
jgi:hypothetical protein